MPKIDKKNRMIEIGADLFHINGYNNTGINEILKSAGVPKGSFYFYFKNKEDFGVNVIEFFNNYFTSVADKHINEKNLPCLDRLKNFFTEFHDYFESRNFTGGCPTGNLAQELGDTNEMFRKKLKENFLNMRKSIVTFLELAKENNEIDPNSNIIETADYIINSWEGSLLRMKIEKSRKPLDLFISYLFNNLLVTA